MNYIAELGVPKHKLNIGIPLYGQSFRLSTSAQGYGAPTKGRGTAGKFTLQEGMLSYYEICHLGGLSLSNLSFSLQKSLIESTRLCAPR